MGENSSLDCRHLCLSGKDERQIFKFDPQDYSVESLDLSRCGLTSIPSWVCSLKSMKKIDVSHNNLDNLPVELGHIEKLEEIIATDNSDLLKDPFAQHIREGPAKLAEFMKSIVKPKVPYTLEYQPIRYRRNPNLLSVFTWNILADSAISYDLYPLCEFKYLERQYRHEKILERLSSVKSDVFLFQEIEKIQFEGSLISFFTNRNFFGHFVPKGRIKHKASGLADFVFGQATFINLRKFEVAATHKIESRYSRFIQDDPNINELRAVDDVTLFTLIRTKGTDPKWILVINVHLKYKSENIRVPFLAAAYNEGIVFALSYCKSFGMIIAGDFNCLPDSVPINNLFRMNSNLKRTHECFNENPTTVSMRGYKGCVDHIIFDSSYFKPNSLLRNLKEEEIANLCPVIPCSEYPSDHYPVGAQFEYI